MNERYRFDKPPLSERALVLFPRSFSRSHGRSQVLPFAIMQLRINILITYERARAAYRLLDLHMRPSHLTLQICHTFVLLLRGLGLTILALRLGELALEIWDDGLFANQND